MRTTASTIAAAAVIMFAIAGCTPGGGHAPHPHPHPSHHPTSSATPSPTPEPEETAAPTLDASDYENIADSINSGNTAALEGYLTDPVIVIFAASECCGPLAPFDAIGSLDYLTNATGPWTFPTAESTIDTYRTGFYADYFPTGAFVGQSSDADPFVISFTITGDKITTIFVSAQASSLLP